MAIDITYNGNSIASLEGGKTAIIKCAGKKMKSDLTVIAPEGGGGGGDCPINIVDELPAVGEEGEIVGVETFADVFVVSDSTNGLLKKQYTEMGYPVYSDAMTSEAFDENQEEIMSLIMGNYAIAFFYFTDMPDIFVYDGKFASLSTLWGIPFNGEITDIAQATEQGVYAYMKLVLYQYTNGEFKELVPESELPTEVSTEAEMTALLETAEVGSVYKYTGETTDTYENGALYVVEESE